MATEDFRRIFESLRVAVAGADAQGVIAFANAAFVELGAAERALPGTDLATLFVPADRKRVRLPCSPATVKLSRSARIVAVGASFDCVKVTEWKRCNAKPPDGAEATSSIAMLSGSRSVM